MQVILGLGWSFQCDLWSVGCILVELITGRTLFQTHENLEHLAMIERVVAPIPSDMVKRASKDAQRYFSASRGSLTWEATATRRSMKMVQQLATLRRLLREEADNSVHPHLPALHALLANMLSLWPGQRMSARQCLQADFFSENIRSLLPKSERPQDTGESKAATDEPAAAAAAAGLAAALAKPQGGSAALAKAPAADAVALRSATAGEAAAAATGDKSVTTEAAAAAVELAGREPREAAQLRRAASAGTDAAGRRDDGAASAAGRDHSSRGGSRRRSLRAASQDAEVQLAADDVQRNSGYAKTRDADDSDTLTAAEAAAPATDHGDADEGDAQVAEEPASKARHSATGGGRSHWDGLEPRVPSLQERERVTAAIRVLRSRNKSAAVVVEDARAAKVPAMLVLNYKCDGKGLPNKGAPEVVEEETHPSDYAEGLAFDHACEANA
jgi:hypothetical protein